MNANWDSYLCTIDGRPASILVDLSLQKAAPLAEYPLLGHARFTVAAPDSLGFPGEEEYARLAEQEHILAETLARDVEAVYAGRSISAGLFDCFFYLSKKAALTWLEQVRQLAESAQAGLSEDPDWDCYLSFLYPDAQAMLTISNRRACEELAEQGDDPEQSRTIEHLASFRSEAEALAFSEAVRGLDFSPSAPEAAPHDPNDPDNPDSPNAPNNPDNPDAPDDQDTPNNPDNSGSEEDTDFPFRVRFRRPDSPAELDQTTFALFALAREHAGIYGGWAAPVVAQSPLL